MGVSSVPYVLVDEFFEEMHSDVKKYKKLVLRLLKQFGIYDRLTEMHRAQTGATLCAFQNIYFQLALQADAEREIAKIGDSGEGSPRDLFHPEANTNLQYTISFLRYFREYQWVKHSVEFGEEIDSVFEVGSGYGGQAEVLLKLHPDLKYIICDIPPQLYIAERYLSTVFPGEVTGYIETRELKSIDLTKTRRVTVVAPWHIAKVDGYAVLLWNSASFQEMEPEIVENYARLLSPLIRKYVYLKENPDGKQVTKEKGKLGVLQPVKMDDYVRFFSEFNLEHVEDAVHVTILNRYCPPFLTSKEYDHMLFRKRTQ